MSLIFSEEEIEIILEISQQITGISSGSDQIKNYILEGTKQRMFQTKSTSLEDYLQYINENENEFKNFLSSITVHTTHWFRESNHFTLIKFEVINLIKKFNINNIRILSAPCSTGEEVYSLGFILETIKGEFPSLNYEIIGTDIDSLSIEKCKNAVYHKSGIKNIPENYHKYLLFGKNEAKDYFAISKEIRKNCSFISGDIRNENLLNFNTFNLKTNKFNIIICRNLFIYFNHETINKIINNFIAKLNDNGIICLGHSEKIDEKLYNLINTGNSFYKLKSSQTSVPENLNYEIVIYSASKQSEKQIIFDKILVILKNSNLINNINDLKQINNYNKLKILLIDIDSKNPELLYFLHNYSQKNKNIFIIQCLFSKEDEFKSSKVNYFENQIFSDILDCRNCKSDINQIILYVKNLLKSFNHESSALSSYKEDNILETKKIMRHFFEKLRPEFIAIGCSTGGTQALEILLKNVPKNFPPILIVQHIPYNFSNEFINKLKTISNLSFESPKNRPILKKGHLYLADDDYHLIIKGTPGELRAEPDNSPPQNELRPSINKLFQSLAHTKAKGVGIILTGMGDDGAQGLLSLMQNGCLTITQSKNSCVIYGMPREAELIGASRYSGDLMEIRQILEKLKV
ncbi:chemotaxis protein CheB [Spirobacillus cienkowskii]|uniref:chemotaxis protein CheB n=1 Tax=Spirobacillus cienkowskii TaxID=495820 RepID=UPI0030CB06C4